ncbi:hypothetical protein XspCFBP7912_18850 [Xanthomonas sp. CFBP 7912]|nr:hypothetical protein XspCFBP7912_18850 [Xanthomonas sp. CFBP 7912]
MRRGRSEARAPVARKLCLFAPGGEGLSSCAALVSACGVEACGDWVAAAGCYCAAAGVAQNEVGNASACVPHP